MGDFSRRGDNRVYIIPGNHDAALVRWKKLPPTSAWELALAIEIVSRRAMLIA